MIDDPGARAVELGRAGPPGGFEKIVGKALVSIMGGRQIKDRVRRPMVVGSLALLPAIAVFAAAVSSGSSESLGWAGLALLPAGYVAGYVLVALLVTVATVAFLSVLTEVRVAGGGSPRAIATCCTRVVALHGHLVSSFGLLRPALPRPPPMHIE